MLNFFGRFHPLLVHLPIGILLLAVLLAFLGRWRRFHQFQPLLPVIVLVGTLGAIFSCLTGYFLSLSGEYDAQVLNQHRNLGIAVAGWGIVLFFLPKPFLERRWSLIFQVLMLVLISAAGHLGGSLTHGSDYLSQAVPEPYRTRLGLGSTRPPAPVFSNLPEANAYAAVVAPLLQSKCVSCHGANKQKGKLRLDQPAFVQKGGKNGTLIVAGNPQESELIRRLLLPKTDEKHMPPKEKNQLSETEIKLLYWWIESGANYDRKIKELPQSEEIKPLLAKLGSSSRRSTATEATSYWPSLKVPAPDLQAIQKLKDVGAVVLPLAQGSHFLSINFINVPKVGANELVLLEPLARQIVTLRLSGVALSDQGLQHLPELPHLCKLFLDGTQLSDMGLARFKSAKYLSYLNLVRTQVSKKGLIQLNNLGKLRHVFVYQTRITSKADWLEIKENFPKLTIDTGAYLVPTLPSDTIRLQ